MKFLYKTTSLEMSDRKALVLVCFIDGKAYHITICKFVNCGVMITRDVISKFKNYFGRNNTFKLNFYQQWGKKSILTKSWNPITNTGLEEIRKKIFDYIVNTYFGYIDTTRYTNTNGLPPQHITTNDIMQFIGQTFDVTYSIQ